MYTYLFLWNWIWKHPYQLIVVWLQISDKKYPKLKEVDDVLGGSAAWENVDATEGVLPLHYS